MSHIFISYAREDAAFAQKLNAELRRRGVTTWLDELGIRSGADWPDRIATAIEECAAMLAILSPDSMVSKWVRRELDFADAKDKKILPLLYRETELPSTFELRFGTVQRADFTHGDFDGGLAKLIVSIEQELGLQIGAPVNHPTRQDTTTGPSTEVELPRVNSIADLQRVSGNRVIWEKDGKEMVRVPAGRFLYGEEKEERYLAEYWIDKTPVTSAEYLHFLDITGRTQPQLWKGKTPTPDVANHPIVRVAWNDAVAYAEWAGKQLPAEEEWEKAARGTDGRNYPWGNQAPTRELCNFNNKAGGTTPVGSFSPQGDSPYGCVDMSGNVREWTDSWYDDGNDTVLGKRRAQRGASYDDVDGQRMSCWFRLMSPPFYAYPYYGFRLLVRT